MVILILLCNTLALVTTNSSGGRRPVVRTGALGWQRERVQPATGAQSLVYYKLCMYGIYVCMVCMCIMYRTLFHVHANICYSLNCNT